METLLPLYKPFRDRRLVEPFVGGMGVTLGLLPKRALLNDVNPHLVNFYAHLKAGLVLDIQGGTTDRTFKTRRNAFNALVREERAINMGDDGRRAAMLFYYLNRHCYNGLCRFNRKGEFNTPNGRYVAPQFHKDLRQYVPILKEWKFTCEDFRDVEFERGDFVYADPPYDDAFTGYSEGGFSRKDQEDLVKKLADHTGPVVLSNHATDDMLQLYERHGFNIDLQPLAPRMIHCKGDRTRVREVVAVKGME